MMEELIKTAMEGMFEIDKKALEKLNELADQQKEAIKENNAKPIKISER